MTYARIFIAISLILLLCTCSDDKATEPEIDPPTDEFGISYTADNARSVSESIAAASGGSVTTVNASGIQFQLQIPAHSLPADTTIEVTPLASLTIEGPGATQCTGCDSSDILCCVIGALFEPSGLEFDSGALLTITYPQNIPFPFGYSGTMIYIDSSAGCYTPPCYGN